MSSTAFRKKGGNQIQKMLISVEMYQQMGAAGIFANAPRIELLDGEIYTKTALSPLHNSHVDKIAEYFVVNLYNKAKVRTQGSIQTCLLYTSPSPRDS